MAGKIFYLFPRPTRDWYHITRWNYTALHCAYVLFCSLLWSVLLYATANPRWSTAYKDCFFLAFSTGTETGLNTVDLSDLSTGQQLIVFISLLCGSHVFFSIILLCARSIGYRAYRPKRPSANWRLEERATWLLLSLVVIYWFSFQALGALALSRFISKRRANVALENGVNPVWLGIFLSISSFNNAGMSLLDANMIPFGTAKFVLLISATLILAGNTCFPIFLRCILWIFLKLIHLTRPSKDGFTRIKARLQYILDNPRNVYTHLFTAQQSWYLLSILILMNSIDFCAFEILMRGNQVFDSIPQEFKAVDGFFQAIALRTAGYFVVALSNLHIGLQFLFCFMMHFSPYPVLLAIRRSDVNEEESLGVTALADSQNLVEATEESIKEQKRGRLTAFFTEVRGTLKPKTRSQQRHRKFLKLQFSRQFWWDMMCPVFALFVILIIEAKAYQADPKINSIFNIIFEVGSAYSNVGLSTGLNSPLNYSLSGSWHTGSQMMIVFVMFMGRHRGLPNPLDKAARMPVEDAADEEKELLVFGSESSSCSRCRDASKLDLGVHKHGWEEKTVGDVKKWLAKSGRHSIA